MTAADKQRRYRIRHATRLKAERAAKRERERIRALPADACCGCCGETRKVFLATTTRCWNCQHAERLGVCPHAGLTTLG